MAPILSLLRSMAEKGTSDRRSSTTGRGPRRTCSNSPSSSASATAAGPAFVPALSTDDEWDGERDSITDVVDRMETDLTEVDAYLCGPPPMVDAAIAMLERGAAPSAHLLRQVHDDRGLTRDHERSTKPEGTT